MKSTAAELWSVVESHLKALQSIPEEKFSMKPSPVKWSKKEIIGHLIDSAHSNARRFVVAQYEDNPEIIYNQDKWVAICNYQQWDSLSLIRLWCLLNWQICEILKNMPAEAAQRSCMTQELHTLEWLANDYIKHLKHHLHQVLGLEPVSYP